jgi:hypothetical protein
VKEEVTVEREALVRIVIAYVHAFRHHLRDQDTRAGLDKVLSEAELESLSKHENVPIAILGLLGDRLTAARKNRATLPATARIRFVKAAMATFDLNRRFDRVIIPYTALYCLAPAARLACLRRVAAHLAPAGRLAFDIYPGDSLAARPAFEDAEPEWIDALRDGDRLVEIFESDRHDPAQARMDVTYHHHIATPDGRMRSVEYTLTHYYLRLTEIAPVLAEAGLTVRSMTGDFDTTPATPDAERLVVVAELMP